MVCHPGTGRYIDTGTAITDTWTGLMWEKKVAGSGCLHCVNDRYAWGVANYWIERVNGRLIDNWYESPFRLHTDWRLPTMSELLSIIKTDQPAPYIDPIFGPTASGRYWSASRERGWMSVTWTYNFGDGYINQTSNDIGESYVRAVRTAW